jgi:hypothetical protein
MRNDKRPIGFTVVNSDGAWLADKGGAIAWTTDPADLDIFLFETEADAAANAEPANGERVKWKDAGHVGAPSRIAHLA